MATGILFAYVDRILPDVAAKRTELETVIKPRIRVLMESRPFSPQEISAYKVVAEQKQRYLHAKRILGSQAARSRIPAHQITAMQAMVTTIEGNAEQRKRFNDLESLGQSIKSFEECQKYMTSGLGAMDDVQLAAYLEMKQAQSFRIHDPIQALTEKQIGPDCPNPKQYIVVFDGLKYSEAEAFCVSQEGDPKTAIKRAYTFRYDLLPASARDEIEADLVPRVKWEPEYMEVKRHG